MKPSLVRTPSTADRLAALEKRADHHDEVIKPMALQVDEIYGFWTSLKTINWFLVKAAAYAGGAFGFIAVVLTIANNGRQLLGH